MTNDDINSKLKGRKITHVDLRPFDDGRGGQAFNPVIILDDGSRLIFMVEETDSPGNDYGVRPMVINRPRPAPGVQRSKGTIRR